MLQGLGQALGQACRQFGDRAALQGQAQTLSYRTLFDQAGAASAQLQAAGLLADEPVLVLVDNQPGDVAALLAVWRAGGVVVAVHRSTPAALVAGLQQRTGARFALDLAAGTVAHTAAGTGSAAGLQHWASTPPPQRPLLAGAAFIIFTSGSTGVPKGVVLSHAAFQTKLQHIDSLLQFAPADRTLLVLNLSFGFGLWLALLTLLRGGTLVMAPKFAPADFVQTLASQRITQVGLVPTMMRVLLSDPALAPAVTQVAAQGDLRQILIGGELLGLSLAKTLRQTFARSALIDIYGLTETSTCDFFAFAADAAQRPGCIGRPSPQVQHRIADAQGIPVAPGVVAELQLRSPCMMAGYLDAPELTAAAFMQGWFCTGDLARQHPDGLVELMGRQKELISRGGNKLTPVEVEQALSAHPDVAAALVVGVADAVLGQRIHVLLVPRSGSALSTAALRQHLQSRLEKFKHPDTWHLGDALPLGRTGKADRTALAALIAAGQTQLLPP